MNNEEMFQIITLLTTVLGCITGMLTFFSKLKETPLMQTLGQVVLVVLPIIYLSKIFTITEMIFFSVSLICLVFSIITCILSIHYNTHLRKITQYEAAQFLPCGFMVLGKVLQSFLPYPFGVANISQEIQNYLDQLAQMKVSLDMYLFMMEEYAITMLLLQKTVLLYLSLRSLVFMFAEDYFKNLRTDLYCYRQSVFFSLISACMSFGLVNWAVQYTISLF